MHDKLRSDSDSNGKPRKCNADQLPEYLNELVGHLPLDRLVFVCIGTDRSTGDALGPLVGSALVRRGITEVIGTLEAPCDASNLERRIADIPEDRIIIAVDACLGHPSTVGDYLIHDQPLIPAQSVGTELPAVGHYSIAAVVNMNSPKPYWTLQTTSLYAVMRQADKVAEAIVRCFMDTSSHK
ncbi:spore protease YyaC [Paenibacillus marinisediminis]